MIWSDVFVCQVEPKKFGLLANWKREYTMEDILTQLKKEMAAPHNRKLVQPTEGTFFQSKDIKKIPHIFIYIKAQLGPAERIVRDPGNSPWSNVFELHENSVYEAIYLNDTHIDCDEQCSVTSLSKFLVNCLLLVFGGFVF